MPCAGGSFLKRKAAIPSLSALSSMAFLIILPSSPILPWWARKKDVPWEKCFHLQLLQQLGRLTSFSQFIFSFFSHHVCLTRPGNKQSPCYWQSSGFFKRKRFLSFNWIGPLFEGMPSEGALGRARDLFLHKLPVPGEPQHSPCCLPQTLDLPGFWHCPVYICTLTPELPTLQKRGSKRSHTQCHKRNAAV
jgi:hypothetical protein